MSERRAYIVLGFVITLVSQWHGAPLLDICGGTLNSGPHKGRSWRGRALHLRPWRRNRYGDRLGATALCIGRLARLDDFAPVTPGLPLNDHQRQVWRPLTYAKDQPQYRALPCLRSGAGEVVTRWRPSLRTRLRIAFGGDLWLTVLTFNQPLQPVLLESDVPYALQATHMDAAPSERDDAAQEPAAR